MRILKFIAIWATCFITMFISWSVGSVLGNVITDSSPPLAKDLGPIVQAFLGVCVLCALLLTALIWFTRRLRGPVRWVTLVMFPFGIQFLLTQMETWFFSVSIGITNGQIASILIAGLVVSSATMSVGILLAGALSKDIAGEEFVVRLSLKQKFMPLLLFMVLFVYPLLYLGFGYFVAWQNEDLRVFYSGSSEIAPFSVQLKMVFLNGIYFFQILRALLWVALTLPVIMMLRPHPVLCYVLGGLLTALLPSSLLFIPNPYMPYGIAMSHFVETSASNLVWGLAMVWVVNRWVDLSKQPVAEVS